MPKEGAGSAGRVFLPFQDDPMLSLILSKAFLLANDAAITDKSIAPAEIRDELDTTYFAISQM